MVRCLFVCFLVLCASSYAAPRAASTSPNATFTQHVGGHFAGDSFATALSGEYQGSKSVLGVTATLDIKIDSDSTADISFSGPLSLTCNSEAYQLQNSQLTFPNADVSGDCLHDDLASNNVKIKSASYDSTVDVITLNVQYAGFLSINFELQHKTVQHPITIGALVEQHEHKLKAARPSGTYEGKKSVVGTSVDVTISVGVTTLALTVTGPVAVDCKNEDYTFGNNQLTLTNIKETGDCVHDVFAKYPASLQAIKFDASGDSLEVDLKVLGLSVAIPLKRTSNAMAIISQMQTQQEDNYNWDAFSLTVKQYAPLLALSAPDGEYDGEKSVVGQSVKATMIFSSSSMALTIEGPISLSCTDEPYTMQDSNVQLTNIGQNGDCVHDALSSNQVTLKSLTYDSASDSIKVELKYSFLTISMDLNHKSSRMSLTSSSSPLFGMNLSSIYAKYGSVFQLQDPSGKYCGTKTVLGQKVSCTGDADASTHTFSLDLQGIFSISCQGEPYSYSNGVITLTNIDKDGDCLHDALKENDITLEDLTYDSSANAISVTTKYGMIRVSLTLEPC